MQLRLTSAVTATLTCVALAACGSDSGSGTATTGSSDAAGIAFSKCMRSHGVTGFPDPGASRPSGVHIDILGVAVPSTIDVHSPAFQSALNVCMKLATGGHPPPPLTTAKKQAALNYARCIRAHGVPNFPDPTFGARGGIGMRLPPGESPSSPALRRATKACGQGP